MRCERGDVVLLDLPFSDATGRKKRPALVIANAAYLESTTDLIVCAITSQQAVARIAGSTSLMSWKEAGLIKPSVVKASLHTVDRALIERRLGRLDGSDLQVVDEALRSVLF